MHHPRRYTPPPRVVYTKTGSCSSTRVVYMEKQGQNSDTPPRNVYTTEALVYTTEGHIHHPWARAEALSDKGSGRSSQMPFPVRCDPLASRRRPNSSATRERRSGG